MGQENQAQKWYQRFKGWLSTQLIRLGKHYLKVAVGLLFLATIFGIVQPFLWQAIYKEPPPGSFVSISILLTIILAILGLGGFALYLEVRGRLSEEIRGRTKEEREVSHQKIQAARDETCQAIENQGNYLAGKIHNRASYIEYEQYDVKIIPFCKKEKNVHKTFEDVFLDLAIGDDRKALDYVAKLPKDNEDYRVLFIQCRNSLAYNLASRRNDADKVEARTIAKELYDEADKPDNSTYAHHLKETYAWVMWRFAGDEAEENKARQTVEMLLENPEPPDVEWRKKLRAKYKVLLKSREKDQKK